MLWALQGERVRHADEPLEVMLKTFAVASVFWLAYQVTQGVPVTLIFSEPYPADSIVEVSSLYTPEAMIEIEAIAVVSEVRHDTGSTIK